MGQYIGSRYVPKFMGTYDSTQEYEVLCVVDNGLGTSYISKKPVPINTPLTDPDYWAIYGASSGAVINLQNQIDNITEGFVTPEMFGAAGDGITDDTQAIQDAVNSGKTVLISSNTYCVKSDNTADSYAIALPDNAKIYGMNGSALKMDSSIKIGRILYHAASGDSNITIDGISFIGYASENTSDETGVCAITLESSKALINNCIFTGFNKNIELTNCINSNIVNNTILNATETSNQLNGYGVLLEAGEHINICNNNFFAIERHAIYLNEVKYCNVENNNIEGQTNDLARYSHLEGNIKIDGVEDVNIVNNHITGNYYGIMILKGFVNYDSKNISIRNNNVSGTIPNSGFAFGGIGVYGQSDTDYEIDGLEISDNIVIGNAIHTDTGYHGIFGAPFVKNMRIRNNFVTGFIRGIAFRTTNPCELSNNKVVDCDEGYRLYNTVSQFIEGTKNHYSSCTSGVVADFVAVRYSRCEGIQNDDEMQQVISGSLITINPFECTRFLASAACSIKTIGPAMQGTIIEIRSAGASTPQLKMADVDTNIHLQSDFVPTAGGAILYMRCVDMQWYEMGRVNP